MASSNYPSSPEKYPYPTEVKFRDFVPVKLRGSSNYSKWRKLMLRLLESQELAGFINGEVVAPAPVDQMIPMPDDATEINKSADCRAWKKSDALLQSWIIGTIHEDLLEIVEDLQTARAMWTTLETVFKDFPTPTRNEYPYPLEVNARKFVPIRLSKGNYQEWRSLMLGLVENQGLGDFINGKVQPPPKMITVPSTNDSHDPEESKHVLEPDDDGNSNRDSDRDEIDENENGSSGDQSTIVSRQAKQIENHDYKVWIKSDGLLRSWILETISEDLTGDLLECETARKMWLRLEENMESTDRERKNLLQGAVISLEDEPLEKAVVGEDWESAHKFLKEKEEAVRARVNRFGETALTVAVKSARRNHIVKKLLSFMTPDDLTVPDQYGHTAIHRAALEANLEAVKLLVSKNPSLPSLETSHGDLPLALAARVGDREMILYLLEVTPDQDIKSQLVQVKPAGAVLDDLVSNSLFVAKRGKLYLAFNFHGPSCIPQWITLRLVASLNLQVFDAPLELEDPVYQLTAGEDIENPAATVKRSFIDMSGRQMLAVVLWKVAAWLEPQAKHIQEKRRMHRKAIQLLKHACGEIAKLDRSTARQMVEKLLVDATGAGIYEVVEEILASFPYTSYDQFSIGIDGIIYSAIVNRNEKLFNLIYQFSKERRDFYLSRRDPSGDTGLHLAARLGNEQRFKIGIDAAGAALQMQRELQWFKEVERLLRPGNRRLKNKENKTGLELFIETHQELVKEGENWTKETATSCTIVAALVATVTFAAAITIPGGNDQNSGLPIFSKNETFKIFSNSNALALFASTFSVLMFLSVLVSRYSENDFLFDLPRKLLLGLYSLVFSMISMMIAFGATLYLTPGIQKS